MKCVTIYLNGFAAVGRTPRAKLLINPIKLTLNERSYVVFTKVTHGQYLKKILLDVKGDLYLALSRTSFLISYSESVMPFLLLKSLNIFCQEPVHILAQWYGLSPTSGKIIKGTLNSLSKCT